MNNKFQKTRIAMLTPSSNSIVEPWCYKIIGSLDNATVHFGRVEDHRYFRSNHKVHHISF